MERDTATTNTENWVHLRLSQVLDGTQGFSTSASGSKLCRQMGSSWVKELTVPLISSASVCHGFHLTISHFGKNHRSLKLWGLGFLRFEKHQLF